MNPRAYSLSIALLVALLCCTFYASAQTTTSHSAQTIALASTDNSLVTVLPYSALEKAGTQTVSLSPNGLVQIEGFSFDRYSVFDGTGEMWLAGPGTSNQIDLGYLPAGVYYLHLATKDGEVVSKVLKGGK